MLKSLFRPPFIRWPQKFEQKSKVAKDERLIDFYNQKLPDSETPLSEVEFVALDFETTGLDPETNDIISIGLVPFTLSRIYLKNSKQWMVRPQKKLDEESVIIHGITHSELVGAPDLDDILDELLEHLKGKIVVVHYRPIERNFLDNALKSRIGEGIEFPVVDTLEIESNVQNKVASSLFNRLKGVKPGSVRLAQSRRRYGLPEYSPHHALTDAIATAELMQAQIAHHYSPSKPIREFWL